MVLDKDKFARRATIAGQIDKTPVRRANERTGPISVAPIIQTDQRGLIFFSDRSNLMDRSGLRQAVRMKKEPADRKDDRVTEPAVKVRNAIEKTY